MRCTRCNRELNGIDIGAYRKLINKCAKEFMCCDCLATGLGWTREYLDDVIRLYRERGCTLFPPLYKSNKNKLIYRKELE